MESHLPQCDALLAYFRGISGIKQFQVGSKSTLIYDCFSLETVSPTASSHLTFLIAFLIEVCAEQDVVLSGVIY